MLPVEAVPIVCSICITGVLIKPAVCSSAAFTPALVDNWCAVLTSAASLFDAPSTGCCIDPCTTISTTARVISCSDLGAVKPSPTSLMATCCKLSIVSSPSVVACGSESVVETVSMRPNALPSASVLIPEPNPISCFAELNSVSCIGETAIANAWLCVNPGIACLNDKAAAGIDSR